MKPVRWSSGGIVLRTVSLGILGGSALILSAAFLAPGKAILVPYMALVGLTCLILRADSRLSLRDAFLVGFGSFMLASVCLYICLAAAPNTHATVLGHAWRIGALALVGVPINVFVAAVAAHPVPTSSPTQPDGAGQRP